MTDVRVVVDEYVCLFFVCGDAVAESLLVPVLWFSVVRNDLQFCVFCSFILALISLFNCWRCVVISCVRGRVELNLIYPVV